MGNTARAPRRPGCSEGTPNQRSDERGGTSQANRRMGGSKGRIFWYGQTKYHLQRFRGQGAPGTLRELNSQSGKKYIYSVCVCVCTVCAHGAWWGLREMGPGKCAGSDH